MFYFSSRLPRYARRNRHAIAAFGQVHSGAKFSPFWRICFPYCIEVPLFWPGFEDCAAVLASTTFGTFERMIASSGASKQGAIRAIRRDAAPGRGKYYA
jgi:hypothetical protein